MVHTLTDAYMQISEQASALDSLRTSYGDLETRCLAAEQTCRQHDQEAIQAKQTIYQLEAKVQQADKEAQRLAEVQSSLGIVARCESSSEADWQQVLSELDRVRCCSRDLNCNLRCVLGIKDIALLSYSSLRLLHRCSLLLSLVVTHTDKPTRCLPAAYPLPADSGHVHWTKNWYRPVQS